MKATVGKILLALCEIAAGVLLLLNPEKFTLWILRGAGVLLLVAGVVSLVRYFRADPVTAHLEQGLARALVEIAVGCACLLATNTILDVVMPYLILVYGVVIFFGGILRVQWAVDAIRMKTGSFVISLIGAVLTIVLGIIVLVNPVAMRDFIWMFIAISLIVSAVFDILAAIFLQVAKKDVQDAISGKNA